MDDKQLAMLLTAMSDQTAAMNRMADAMAGILFHLDPKQAAKFAAPGYMRPLAAYATFDWSSIDAPVIAFDRHGATEVEHNGVAYRRYRSNDDDPKGVDIRFRRVVSGTPEGKDMVWATLIKFADKKAKDAPRPLRGELAEKIEQAAAEQAIRANAPVPMHAPTPAVARVAAPAPVVRAEPEVVTPPEQTPVTANAADTLDTDPVAEMAQKLGGELRTASPEENPVLAEMARRFDALPSGTARTAALRTLKAEINTEAIKRGLEPFEGRSGEALPAAEKRMRNVLDACIEADARLAKA